MKLRKEINAQAGGGYFIYVKIGDWECKSWWKAPPKDEKHFHWDYLKDRYPKIRTEKRAEQFNKLWIEMWDKEDKPKACKIIEEFIKEYGYTYKVEDVLEEYPKFKKYYVSHTMEHCINNLEFQIKVLLELWEV